MIDVKQKGSYNESNHIVKYKYIIIELDIKVYIQPNLVISSLMGLRPTLRSS